MNSFESLSEREKEVTELLLQGKSNKQIAQALNVTTRTVEYHLSSIYKKLRVASRAEALLLLSENRFRESTVTAESAEFREPTVENGREPAENEGNPIPQTRRFPLNKTLLTLFALGGALILGLFVFILVYNFSVPQNNGLSNQDATQAVTAISMADAPVSVEPTATMAAALSPRQQNVAEARRLAEEYDQAIQAEMQKGNFEIQKDSKTGKDIISFQGESRETLLKLFDELDQELFQLNQQYLALYLTEVQPTPFLTQPSEQENEDYYHALVQQYPAFFDQVLKEGPTVEIFDPGEGTYVQRVIGDAYAQGSIMERAMNALHDAPQLAKVDQEADTSLIRAAMENPDLSLSFQCVRGLANAPFIQSAVYVDDSGTKYSVSTDKGILTGIEPNLSSHADVPALEVKPIEEVRKLAEQFVEAHSPGYVSAKNRLTFEENGKGDIYFFTWRLPNQDWSNTDWAIMPPFLQIGMSADGNLLTFIDTLDLYQE